MTLSRKPRIEAPFIIGRRKFLTGSAGLATFGLLAGCSGAGIDPTSLITQTATTATSLAETQSLGEKDEIQIGNTLYGRIVDSQGGYYRNAAVQAEMERFAAPLIATAQRQHLPRGDRRPRQQRGECLGAARRQARRGQGVAALLRKRDRPRHRHRP